MGHYGINTPMISFHEHNEKRRVDSVLDRIAGGESVALVSDAGTPLVSDPGYPLVSAASSRGITVSPVPGPCALVAALSASGLAVDRFVFEGFVPPKAGPRDTLIRRINDQDATVVMYESSHRILATLSAMKAQFASDRQMVIGREISKKFESFYRGSAASLLEQLEASDDNRRGEFVIMVSAAVAREPGEEELRRMLAILLAELPLKSASRIAANWFGRSRKLAYAAGLDLERNGRSICE